MSEPAMPTTIVISGASGDLTHRKLIPALFKLHRNDLLPAICQIVGFASTLWDSVDFRRQMRAGIAEFSLGSYSDLELDTFIERLYYTSGSFTEAADYMALCSFLDKIEGGAAHRLFYLATPPRFFADIVAQLGAAGMAQETPQGDERELHLWRRLIIEKPFGRDFATARTLNLAVHAVLAEHQIYRIDHYLAKETVQNMLVFRFGNTMFEPIWNRNYIDHVQITVAVGHRAGYYDTAGVLRDMFQNHLMQLLAMVGMEPPASLLLNVLEGDATLFTRSDGIEAAWRVIDPILQEWQTDTAPPLASYAPGSWGPETADELLAHGGRKWR